MASMFSRIGRWLFNQPYLLLCFTSLFWAVNVVIGRFVAGHVPPIALSFLRWSGAFLILLPVAWPYLKRDWRVIRANMMLMTVLSITGISSYNTMAYLGLQYTEAINALLIQSTGPLLIALWALVLFGDRLTLAQSIGIITSLSGVVVIICRGDLDILTSIALNRGDIWFLAALSIFAFYSALAKKRPAIHPLAFLAFTMGCGALWLTPLLLWEISTGYTVTFDALTLATLAYVMVFPSILSYLFFNRGVELVGPNRSAPFLHLIPVFGSFLAIFFLGEQPRLYHLIGYMLVLSGVIAAARG